MTAVTTNNTEKTSVPHSKPGHLLINQFSPTKRDIILVLSDSQIFYQGQVCSFINESPHYPNSQYFAWYAGGDYEIAIPQFVPLERTYGTYHLSREGENFTEFFWSRTR